MTAEASSIAAAVPSAVAPPPGFPGPGGGAPDAALIARLANSFFQALPGAESDLPEPPAAPVVIPSGNTPPVLSSADIPGPNRDFSIVPQSLGGVLSLVPQSLPASGPSLRPGGNGAGPAELPVGSYYFLDHLTRVSAPGVPGVPAGPNAVPASPTTVPAPTRTLRGLSPEALTVEGLDFQLLPVEHRPSAIPDLNNAARPFDPGSIRRDFPLLQEQVHGRPLIWLDNAATTQKPRAVIDRLTEFYEHENSNIHRAAHALAARATDAYEAAREKVRRFLGAASTNEIVFVRGATEGINLIAQSWGRRHVGAGDEIVITWLEHHANIVPWQQLAAEKGARLKVAPVDDTGQIILEEYAKLITPRTRIVSLTQVSNALGTVTPVKEMVAIAHRHGAVVLVDGAQAVSHIPVNVQELDADFYVFSGHKVFGPTGIGVVYGKEDILNATPPWQGGGNMIADVTFEKTLYQPAPFRFEAGTGNIADAVGLGAAIDYLEQIGMAVINRYEHDLLVYGTRILQTVPGLRLIGTAAEKAGVLSFVLDGFRTEEVGQALDREGIAVRSGHHCAQPILRRFGLESTVRPSLALYNTCEDLDALVAALLRIQSGHGLR